MIRHGHEGRLLAVTVVALLSAACRPDEQNRPLSLEPHVYRGTADSTLSAEQVEALVKRTGAPQI